MPLELFLDVDGVVLDFESSFVNFIRDYYIPDLASDFALKTWEITDEFKDLDIQQVWNHFVNHDCFTRLDLLVSRDAFNAVSRRYPVDFITNIPKPQYSSREANLQYHQLEYRGLYLAGHFDFGEEGYPTKPEMIASLRTPGSEMVFLDDHPKNCQAVKEAFPESRVYLMSRPHNSGAEGESWIRVQTWQEFAQLLD